MFAGMMRFSSTALRTVVRSAAALATMFALTFAPASAQQQFVRIEDGRKNVAWWVVADFQPFTTEILGIPANQIQKNWCKATEFRKDLIPKELIIEQGIDSMEANKVAFSVEGHFDGSLTKQVALVGVYQECSGQKGRFVLILDKPIRGKPIVRFVSAVQTDRQFGALGKGEGNSLIVWSCMECGGRSVLRWDRKKHKFDWLPELSEN